MWGECCKEKSQGNTIDGGKNEEGKGNDAKKEVNVRSMRWELVAWRMEGGRASHNNQIQARTTAVRRQHS